VTTLKRVPLLPSLPTISEAGLNGYEAGNWFGLLVPAKTPREVVAALHNASVAVLRDPAMIKRLNDMAYVPVGSTPEELAAHMRREVERLGKIVRALNLSAD
jgi:tripartite-type tricarboxylate transporter receptor subunit TctC